MWTGSREASASATPRLWGEVPVGRRPKDRHGHGVFVGDRCPRWRLQFSDVGLASSVTLLSAREARLSRAVMCPRSRPVTDAWHPASLSSVPPALDEYSRCGAFRSYSKAKLSGQYIRRTPAVRGGPKRDTAVGFALRSVRLRRDTTDSFAAVNQALSDHHQWHALRSIWRCRDTTETTS